MGEKGCGGRREVGRGCMASERRAPVSLSLQARANGRRCHYRTRLTLGNGDDSPETAGARDGMSPSVTRWMRLS